ncbi:hypothetical protein H6G93_09285 [Nostoc sp. FACHB-973]|nr:hypothetical protein [Nostoc sp. FACHB-973]
MCDPKVIERAYKMFLTGSSLRELEIYFKMPKSSIRERFIKMYGKDYASKRNSYGAAHIISEYLNSKTLSPKQKLEIKKWFYSPQTLRNIMYTDHKNPSKLLSDRQIEVLTTEECGHKSKDWKELFEVLQVKKVC